MSIQKNVSKQIQFRKIRQLIDILENPISQTRKHVTQPTLDRQEIRKAMKVKWKDPGYSNSEFEKAKILRAKLLNQWQIQRINLATRSYLQPKDYHGIKYDRYSRDFGKLPKDIYPKKFRKYLKQQEDQFENRQFQQKSPIKKSLQMQFQLTGLKFHRANDTLFGYNKKDYRTKKHLSFSQKAKTFTTVQ